MIPKHQVDDILHLAGIGASLVLYGEAPQFLDPILLSLHLRFKISGFNLCLLAQLTSMTTPWREMSVAKSKLWMHLAVFLSFGLVSCYLFLGIYAEFLGLSRSHGFPDGFVAWMNNAKLEGIWLAVWVSGLASAWTLDTLLVGLFQHAVQPLSFSFPLVLSMFHHVLSSWKRLVGILISISFSIFVSR